MYRLARSVPVTTGTDVSNRYICRGPPGQARPANRHDVRVTVRFPQPVDEAGWAEADYPLGAHLDPTTSTVTFAVYAGPATRVQLDLFSAATGFPAFASYLPARGPDGIWRAKLSGLAAGALYGYRCWGQNWPYRPGWQPGSAVGFSSDISETGDRFNPNKLLFDPYAREVTHNVGSLLIAHSQRFGTGGALIDGQPRRNFDTSLEAPKGIVIDDHTPTGVRPLLPDESAIIYEAHVRGLTAHPSTLRLADLFSDEPGFELFDLPDDLRGTYAGVRFMAPYLRALGFTTLELLPVHQFNTSADPPVGTGVNAWGYQSVAYFAPHRAYAHDQRPGGPTREFKEMVAALHDAGLEVYLDVVYNHTGEGGHWDGDVASTGFTSLGGFATSDYYVLGSDQRLVDGATGCANQVNLSSQVAQNLVLDSLRYWADEMGVDGFRFDLATVLGRKPDDAGDDWASQREFHPRHPLLVAIADEMGRRQVEVIAEAWDLWGYEVGNFPHGWAEWNGRYRDAVRGFLKGDGNVIEFITQLNGDWVHFHDQGGPAKAVNFVTAHDGFTMLDLVSFTTKTNSKLDYPFGPSDGGTDDNRSWDSGLDHALRRTRVRNFWTVLMLSRGVPMVVSGDEYGRTQNGNNNPWNIDTVGMWNNYAQAVSNEPTRLPVDPGDPAAGSYFDVFGHASTPPDVNPVFRFARAMAQFRAGHPALKQREWGDGLPGGSDVSYVFSRRDGTPGIRSWERSIRILIDVGADQTQSLLVLVNMNDEPRWFAAPIGPGWRWRVLVDTSARAEASGNFIASGPFIEAAGLDVDRWSIMVLHAHQG